MTTRALAHVTQKSMAKYMQDIKNIVLAFDSEVKAVPEPQDHCVHCAECRQRASKLSDDFKNYWKAYLK